MLTELEALVALTTIPLLGSIKIRLLLEHFGSATAALKASPETIAKLPDFGPKIIQGWLGWQQQQHWKQNIALAEKHGVEILPYTHAQYPKRLLEIPDYPVLLYVKGQLTEADQRCIAVVGTRRASIYGREMADRISQDLAAAGFAVVSGLARGIDACAHTGALRHGRTLAVIGSGLADIYPPENIPLSHAITNRGALISEFPMATPPDRQTFPQRNRIVSGMTLATILIEAPIKSGAMITVEKALAYRRKVFALPGRADCEDFRGNHLLIKNGQAQLIENARDVIAHFDDLLSLINERPAISKSCRPLSSEESAFLSQLPSQEVSLEEILRVTGLPIAKINVLLMGLVLKKEVKEFPGKIYKKV